MRKLPIFITFFLLAGLFSCKETVQLGNDEVDTLIFGIGYGECLGECLRVYRLNDAELWEDTTTTYLGDYLNYTFNSDEQLSSGKFEQVKDLRSEVPVELFLSENKTFGCPDCYDHGSVYVEFKKGELHRRFVLDPDTTSDQSEEVIEFKLAVMQELEFLRN